MPDADLGMAIPSVFFGAIGTAGQRCTSTRRLYLHKNIAEEFLERLQKVYSALKPGDPLDEATLLGPVHSATAVDIYEKAVRYLQDMDAQILAGGARYAAADAPAGHQGNFVQPTIAIPKSVDPSDTLWQTECFAPILNCAVFDDLEEAIRWNNAVPQVRWQGEHVYVFSMRSCLPRACPPVSGRVISETSAHGLGPMDLTLES